LTRKSAANEHALRQTQPTISNRQLAVSGNDGA